MISYDNMIQENAKGTAVSLHLGTDCKSTNHINKLTRVFYFKFHYFLKKLFDFNLNKTWLDKLVGLFKFNHANIKIHSI